MISKTQTKKEATSAFKFYKADVEKLKATIDSTAEYLTTIASAGNLSRDVLAKAAKGGRVSKVKALGICSGLNKYNCSPKAELNILFPYGEN